MDHILKSMLLWVVVGAALVCMNSGSGAEDKKVPEAEKPPSLPKEYSKEAPTSGLAKSAASATVIVICPRGGFALAISAAEKTGTVFEYGGKGFDSKLTYLGAQAGFLYYSVQGWQIIMAIRNEAVGGKHDMWFFVNGSSTPLRYSDGIAYPPE